MTISALESMRVRVLKLMDEMREARHRGEFDPAAMLDQMLTLADITDDAIREMIEHCIAGDFHA